MAQNAPKPVIGRSKRSRLRTTWLHSFNLLAPNTLARRPYQDELGHKSGKEQDGDSALKPRPA